MQCALVADLRLKANEHPKFEDDVRRFSGKINEHFVEWVIDVRLSEAELKDETKPRLGPRLHRRGLLGQPKQMIQTLRLVRETANFTVDNSIDTLRNDGFGESLEEKGQEALYSDFDRRQGKAEMIQDYINREEMMSLSLQNSTKIGLDQKMRGSWLIRTSVLSEQENRKYQNRHRRREEVRDDRREQEE